MVRFRIDLGFASSRFMQRISSGRMGYLAQVHIFFPYLATNQEMVSKKSGKSQGISLKVEENLCFSEKLGKIEFLSPILVL